MDRKRVGYAVVCLLAVLAVALAASTLTNPQQNAGGTSGPGETEEPKFEPEFAGELQIPGLMLVLIAIIVVLAVGSVLAAVLMPRRTLREFLTTVGAAVAVVAIFGLVMWLMEDATSSGGFLPGGNETSGGGQGAGAGGGSGPGSVDAISPTPPDVPLVALLAVALLVVGVVVVATRRRGDEEPPTETADDAETLTAIGRSAGRLADHLEASATVDNEVYRAWKEMTDHLDIERPEAATPGEFREAAVGAGMGPRDVDRLTDLFEEVRYGGFEPTDRREDRAVEALRRIERRYAGGEP